MHPIPTHTPTQNTNYIFVTGAYLLADIADVSADVAA